MGCFKCAKCGCAENTALSRYWFRDEDELPLCSQCDPKIGKWHGNFPRKPYDELSGKNKT